MYEFKPTQKIEIEDSQVSYDVQVLLDEIAKLTSGKTKRVPIYTLLKRAADIEENTLVQRVLLATLAMSFIQSSTTNTEVIEARGAFNLLGDYLADIEYRLDRYDDILSSGLYLPPPEEPERDASTVTFIIQRGGG